VTEDAAKEGGAAPEERSVFEDIHPRTLEFYRRVLHLARDSGIPFMVGGAFALRHYTGIERWTKDFDLFIRPGDYERLQEVLTRTGYRREDTDHWLGKAFDGDEFVDIIFSSGNGVARVDDEWLANAVEGEALGERVPLIPVEEMIWSKGFVMERERFDGHDVVHLIRSQGSRLDWDRLLRRFGDQWPVLLQHLLLFRYVFPGDRHAIPEAVMTELLGRLQRQEADLTAAPPTCRGRFVSQTQYRTALERWGYADGMQNGAGPGGPAGPTRIAGTDEGARTDEGVRTDPQPGAAAESQRAGREGRSAAAAANARRSGGGSAR
jgi:hypothetical protein